MESQSLDTLLTVMQHQNSFAQNQPSLSVAYKYDKDQNIFILLDQTGNLETIDYLGEFPSLTTTKFIEYDINSNYNLIGFSLDFKNNNMLAYSQTQVFHLCYGDLLNNVIQLRTSKKQLFTKILPSIHNQNDDNSKSFVIAGDQGLLYRYSNTQFEYFYQLDEEILGIIYNQKIITHYDFKNQVILSTIELKDPQSFLIKFVCSSKTPFVYLGFSNGDIILYNRQTFKQFKIDLANKQDGQQQYGLEIGFIVETSTDLWVSFSNSLGVFKINIQNNIFQQIIQFDNLTTYKMQQQLNVMIFDLDELNSRIFLNFVGEKVMRVFDLSGNLVQHLSLPCVMNNSLQINELHLLVYTTFQVMIYDRNTLQYIQSIRRDNHYNFIIEVVQINDQYLVLLSQDKYELFKLQQNSIEGILIDQVMLQSPVFMDYSIRGLDDAQTSSLMQIFILSDNQVLEQKYDLVYENIKTLNKICSIEISVNSFFDVMLSINKIKPMSYPDPSQRSMITAKDYSLNNYLDILLNIDDLRTIDFQNTLNSLTQVYPVKNANPSENENLSHLQIYQDSFQLYFKKQVQIRNFGLIFQNNLEQINFYQFTQNVTFHNIQIASQVVDKVSFQFVNMKLVILNEIQLCKLQREQKQFNSGDDWLFVFKNINQVLIYNLVLDNQNIESLNFGGLISVFNVQTLIIKNLVIKNSKLYSLIYLGKVQNLTINNLQIINCQQASNNEPIYILNIVGVTSSYLQNILITNNQNLLFVYTSNIYEEDGIRHYLQRDNLNVKNLNVTQNLISYSISQSLISIQNSNCNFNNITYQNNQGNMYLSKSQNFLIENSQFYNNTSLNGGALSLLQSNNLIVFKNCQFQYNKAHASGGAIYFENVNAQINMDDTVKINQNEALIGGGIRLYNNQQNMPQTINFNYKNIIFNNSAQMYGNNVGTFIQRAMIRVIQKISQDNNNLYQKHSFEYKIIQSQNMSESDQQKYQEILQIQKFQSGSMLNLSIQLADYEGELIRFQQQKYNYKQYPESIMDELSQIKFKIQPETLDQNIMLNGHNIITSSDFDDANNQFIFSEIQITSMPNQTTDLIILSNYTLQYINVLPIQIQIQMRVCYPGEVVKQIENNIYSCNSCPYGQYSLVDPTQDEFWIQNIAKTNQARSNGKLTYLSQCQQCPDSATLCQNNTIALKSGYWRANNASADIVQCSLQFNACDEQDNTSRNGCLRGYMGPACKICDSTGQIWDGQRYSYSYISQEKCNLCRSMHQQILFILLTGIVLAIYFLFSTIAYFDQFIHSCLCYYLRQLNMIPISRNSIKDQTSFYIKIFVNYTQISSVLIIIQVNYFSDIFTNMPNYISDPNSQIITNINCVIPEEYINQHGLAHILQTLYALLPLLFLLILILITYVIEKLKCMNIKKYHKYTLMNCLFIFFQPNQIVFFSKQLTCTQIGSEYYVTSDLTLKCGDQSYNQFTYTMCIPLIVIWSLFPFIIFKLLQKKSSKLQSCITLYYFGYYYQEYKEKYYYWEFIRIYLRVIVVVAFTLTSQTQFLGYLIFQQLLFSNQIILQLALQKQETQQKIFSLWKKIQRNLSLIIQLKAIERVSDGQSKIKKNYSLVSPQNNAQQHKIPFNKVQNSIIIESSNQNYCIEKENWIQVKKYQSKLSQKGTDSQLPNQIKSEIECKSSFISPSQKDLNDEQNFKSDVFLSSNFSKPLDINYETQFKLIKYIDSKRETKNQNQKFEFIKD
ncbi:transmembrane protein, putative (macronuclear) [Tetrahymena thermophila SB210]|uniref:Transmembrane protein, putative n=1 Tax=Tetrahymena thermophila (strain SB210) TaxID=312017 RepID=I7M2A7_TETTS|nr:transmembrane protein, putative [Tetrahymena thermophila SB210]EAR99647.2 transmembrane protein, putative [Tetrahymena thermophila SB210]|eukprot:XP_001019892.2 transmembrane protein, putative [Tetrahymena thermophila SB210]